MLPQLTRVWRAIGIETGLDCRPLRRDGGMRLHRSLLFTAEEAYPTNDLRHPRFALPAPRPIEKRTPKHTGQASPLSGGAGASPETIREGGRQTGETLDGQRNSSSYGLP